jgi:hypothetical protein
VRLPVPSYLPTNFVVTLPIKLLAVMACMLVCLLLLTPSLGQEAGGSSRIATFDAPGASGTFPVAPGSINERGEITGFYGEANNRWHGFVRSKSGTVITFDVPGAGTGPGQGTFGDSSEHARRSATCEGGFVSSHAMAEPARYITVVLCLRPAPDSRANGERTRHAVAGWRRIRKGDIPAF